MIFEKNPFTTAVCMPKSFRLTPFSPTFKIHQPTLILLLWIHVKHKPNNESDKCLILQIITTIRMSGSSPMSLQTNFVINNANKR